MTEIIEAIKDRWQDIQDPGLPISARQARERKLAYEDILYLLNRTAALEAAVKEKEEELDFIENTLLNPGEGINKQKRGEVTIAVLRPDLWHIQSNREAKAIKEQIAALTAERNTLRSDNNTKDALLTRQGEVIKEQAKERDKVSLRLKHLEDTVCFENIFTLHQDGTETKGIDNIKLSKLFTTSTKLVGEIERLREALKELHALVKGECPSLLDEDSGGLARLDIAIEAALKGEKEAEHE